MLEIPKVGNFQLAEVGSFALVVTGVTNAQCWSHSRRYFVDAEKDEPQKTAHVLSLIRALYAVEEHIQTTGLHEADKLSYRREHSKEIVETLFTWIENELQHPDLLPKSPYAKALNYVRNRQAALLVFLADPQVPLDTNHIERRIRSIAMGRRNWLFCCVPQAHKVWIHDVFALLCEAMEKMTVGPSESAIRSRLQTTPCGCH